MAAEECPDSSFSYEEKYGKKGEMIKKIIEALKASDTALKINELKERIGYNRSSDYAIEIAIIKSEEIKSKNIEQVMKEFNLKKYSFNVKSKMRIFYLNEEQVKNFAKKYPYYFDSNF